MSTLGIINSDTEIQRSIKITFQRGQEPNSGQDKDLLFLTQEDEILGFLKYALPELVVINFSDPTINISKIIEQIQNDKWILNFGIIGLFDNAVDREEELLKKYKESNVLAMLDKNWINSLLIKSIEIIEQNYQIIFQREFTKTFLEGASGSFILDNDIRAVPLYAGICATVLSQRGLINPDKKTHLQLALVELVVNAIEHGNCRSSREDKSQSKVFINWVIKPDESVFTIRDQGEGFDVRAYIEKVKKQSDNSPRGGGIRMAAKYSAKLRYNAKGNQVKMIISHDASVKSEVPAGFNRERVVSVKKGDVIMREGEPSDTLYYISSGTYEVLHNEKRVGSLSAQDIFMGEMSFLLDQRRSATIKATSAGKLILLTQKTFVNIIREYPYYGVFLSKLLAKRLIRSNIQVAARQ